MDKEGASTENHRQGKKSLRRSGRGKKRQLLSQYQLLNCWLTSQEKQQKPEGNGMVSWMSWNKIIKIIANDIWKRDSNKDIWNSENSPRENHSAAFALCLLL